MSKMILTIIKECICAIFYCVIIFFFMVIIQSQIITNWRIVRSFYVKIHQIVLSVLVITYFKVKFSHIEINLN